MVFPSSKDSEHCQKQAASPSTVGARLRRVVRPVWKVTLAPLGMMAYSSSHWPIPCYAPGITDKGGAHMTEINSTVFPKAQRRGTLAPANRSTFADSSQHAAPDLGFILA